MNMRAWSLLLLLFLSSAISAQHADHYLDTPLPQAWEEGGEVFRQTLPVDDQWWKSFGDTTLDSLISIAVDRNYSVLTAIDRMNMAKAGLRMERSGFFPTVGINAGWTRQQTSGNTSELPQSTQHYYDVSANMSWELDIFGSIRQRVKAQKETFAASKEEYTAVMVSLSAQVASSYIQLRELQQELKVVERNCASQAAVLKITEVRYNTGLVSKLDVAQAKSVYFSTKASIPQLESGINQYITSLAVLLGTYPQEIRPVLERVGELPDYMEPISIGIPADLLMRRPDIRSAEHQINAQAASLGASKSDWLPQVFIKGSVGYASKDFKDLTKHKSFTYEIAPALSWTIFSGGKLVNATKSARAQLDEAIDQFNQTVLTAVQETDNAMTAYRSSIKQIVALREVRNQGQETLTLSLDLYKQGLTPFQNVLDAQRSLLSYENQLVQARGNSLLQLIALYQALGGGWNN
ncbi:efflux transporter outer membrane subunit [Bacteroides salyersiae]|jgi:efflux transporter, outer membrane factor lipoprotein, NodT family|uniref:efflux transporter outer membrane subunit n=1 Tax=Bacteroides salyersiae TaxID=291644 RepID=UPI000327140B|nr:TolC family protein [Bacteroides salyersiae]EOA48790.1 NodT family efflux transporter, outer membrane factor (OMF) lipoprotein [Bacteroides salyersiae WAL 10018 = DSM 18765 = JCM 12988]UYU39362.1 TolC family protein [Bacteroides salyersiae]